MSQEILHHYKIYPSHGPKDHGGLFFNLLQRYIQKAFIGFEIGKNQFRIINLFIINFYNNYNK